MLDIRGWRARRAQKRAALADPTAQRAAKKSARATDQGRDISSAGPWAGGGAI